MMSPTIVFWALLAIAIFGVLARVARTPYPIVMVLGGALVAVVPGLPRVQLPPDFVFLVMLPPLLFAGGWTTDVRNFKRFLEPILLLAFGLVIFTTITVAYFAHAFIGLPLAAAFVLGAILSPPDAIATEAIGESVPFPLAIATILSGESLVNDATALVIYRFAVAAVVTGTFSLATAAWQLVYVSIVGIAIGLAIAEVAGRIQIALRRRGLVDDVTATIVSLATPFLAYLPAEAAHVSGVLAAVAAGMSLSRRSADLFDGEMRVTAGGAWGVAVFALNGVAFLAIGLQLPSLVAGLSAYRPATLATYGAITSGIVIASRFVWIFGSVFIRRTLGRLRGFREARLTWRGMVVMSWAGMRGIVTLAAALALPAATRDGTPFPGRDLILFLAFVTIVVTLVGQGLTLPFIMRKLDVVEDQDDGTDIARGRVGAAVAARERLRELEADFESVEEWTIAGRLIAELDQRIDHFGRDAGAGLDGVAAHERDLALRRELYGVERAALSKMRHSGEITDRAYRDLTYEIDLAEARLGV